MKLSFSLPSKASSSSSSAALPDSGEPPATSQAADGNPQPQFITVFDPTQPLPADAPRRRVIPPIPNSYTLRPSQKLKNLSFPLPSDDPTSQSDTHFVLDTSSSSAIPDGLTLRSPAADSSPRPESVEDSMLRRLCEDMEILPADRGMKEFDDMPVERYGAAILAGYGWSEGKGIGRRSKGDVKVVQYEGRRGSEGLGYKHTSDDPKHSRWRKEKTADQEEKLPAERHGRSEIVGEEVRVREDMVAELRLDEEDKCSKKLKVHEMDVMGEKRRSRGGGVQWLKSHIRVRIMSRSFRGGELYGKKGMVVDVVGPMTCDVSLDESGELVQGVEQEILETVLPECGGSVLVHYGEHKGVFGSLLEKNMEEEVGVVRDADSHVLINVPLDQIAEYVGDPSYLGY